MKNLTFNYKNQAFTDSTIIAQGAEVEHRAVIQLITNHLDDVSEFGRVAFQMIPFETNGGIQKMKVCRLNEQQATFVISLMKNTKPVVEFKKELVKQFYEMKQIIEKLVKISGYNAKLNKEIKLLYENPKDYYFINENKMINCIVTGMSSQKFKQINNIKKGTMREHFSYEQLQLLEKIIKKDIWLFKQFPNYDYKQRKNYLENYKLELEKVNNRE